MGNAHVPRCDEPWVLLAEYNDLAYQDMLGSYKLFKVMKCRHEREELVLVKLFIHREGAPDLQELRRRVLQVRDAFRSHWLHPNVVPYQGLEVGERSALLLRPHFARNLYDRMHTRPFLSESAKNWIAFQVLCSVCQAHAVGVAHGDLKTENVFVSSWNHTVLSDFANFKPLVLPRDDPSEFSFFFESNLNRRRCYLAPERFDAPSSVAAGTAVGSGAGACTAGFGHFSEGLASMDIFSLGCVIAELFLEGQTVMDLPELLRYRAGQLDLRGKISGIKNKAVQDIVASMLERDPLRRKPAIHYLRDWCARVAPKAFCNCLFPLSVLLLHPLYQQPDMRAVLLRFNFASLLWSTVGSSRLARALGLAPGAHGAVVWSAWLRHVERRVRSIDGASLHGMAHAAAQAAAQRAEAPAPESNAEACSWEWPQPSASGCEADGPGGSDPNLTPALAQPWLREEACEAFTRALQEHWEEGCHRCIAAGSVDVGEARAAALYGPFLAELCSGWPPGAAPPEPPGPGAGSGAEGADPEEDVLGILCGIICSTLRHLSNPRMRSMCLDMLEHLAPFASQSAILEQIVPYGHMLMTDPVAKVRARAMDALTSVLARVEDLPPSDTALFLEYLFPQLMSAMSDMSGEPMVLLAVARNIGTLTKHALRFAELAAAAARRGGRAGEQDAPQQQPGALAVEQPVGWGRRSSTDGTASGSTSSNVEVETFDMQWKRIREAVKKVVKALLEYLPAGPQADRFGADAEGAAQEEPLLNLAMGREVKICLLRNMCVLAESFGKECTHSFLLPYLISFMNDPAWEVRAAFCEEAALLPRKVGQVSTEGIIWPCYEQALLDQEERVLQAALGGLAALVAQQVLRRQSLTNVATKVGPMLIHPSGAIRQRAAEVIRAVGSELSEVDCFVFVLPTVHPFLQVEVLNLEAIGGALLPPLSRRAFKRALLRRDEELHEALLQKRPLPMAGPSSEAGSPCPGAESGGAAALDEQDRDAFDLLRPYLHPLLLSRPSLMPGAAPPGPALKDDRGGYLAGQQAIAYTLYYSAVNPHCASNLSLQALAESDDGVSQWPFAAVPRMRHPLGLFSMQAFLTQALCLPPRPRELGSLNHLDGTPYSIYDTAVGKADFDNESRLHADGMTGQDSVFGLRDSILVNAARHSLITQQDLCESLEPSVDALVGSGGGAASERRLSTPAGLGFGRGQPRCLEEPLSMGSSDAEERGRCSTSRASWRPRGALLATLYEYAHQSGVPVVKVDTTDDSRILVTGGKDGVVKIWNCAQLERDVAVASSHTFTVPCTSTRRRQRLRALRTVRNSKAVAVGSESGEVLLYRIDSRGNTNATEVCRFTSGAGSSASGVMCIEQFDTELESLVVFAQESGAVQGWDLRKDAPSWSAPRVPPWLGVPSGLALGGDGRSMVVGTMGGGLLVYDLRFLAPWKQWRLASGSAALCMRSARIGACPSPSVFVALDSDSNDVALFDVVRGACLTLFLTEPVAEKQKEAAVNVPTLLQAQPQAGQLGFGATADQPAAAAAGARRASGSVRSLWLPPRGPQGFLLAAGTDRLVRRWSLDPERRTGEAYIVTPADSLGQVDKVRARTTYTSNHLGDVFVVQEQSAARCDPPSSWGGPRSPGGLHRPGPGPDGGEEARPCGSNPNHRDAILDMCMISLQTDILVTAGRDGLVKLWK